MWSLGDRGRETTMLAARLGYAFCGFRGYLAKAERGRVY